MSYTRTADALFWKTVSDALLRNAVPEAVAFCVFTLFFHSKRIA